MPWSRAARCVSFPSSPWARRLHLGLDSLQIKPGSGVHLLAPFDWGSPPWGLVSPGDWSEMILGAVGLLVVAIVWSSAVRETPELTSDRSRWLMAGGLALVWMALPLSMMASAERADVAYVSTLRLADERTGREIRLYNSHWLPGDSGPVLLTLTSEPLVARGLPVEPPARLSVDARFLDPSTVEVTSYRLHRSVRRDLLNYVGLALVAGAWLAAVGRARGHSSRSS